MASEIRQQLKLNLEAVRTQIVEACGRSNRLETAVRLVAVSKYAKIEWVRELISLSAADLGEARPQQLIQRRKELPSSVRWHLIGHLQRNKVEDLIRSPVLIHSVDSVRLFDCLLQTALKRNIRPQILLEVNVSGEASKDGFRPEELKRDWPRLSSNQSVHIDGLMTMAPLDETAEASRPYFRQLRMLRDELNQQGSLAQPMTELSMGMSGDFQVAIEEGATLVRVGSRLFEGLDAIHNAEID